MKLWNIFAGGSKGFETEETGSDNQEEKVKAAPDLIHNFIHTSIINVEWRIKFYFLKWGKS